MVLVGGSDSHVAVALCRGEVRAQLLGRAEDDVARGVALDAPALGEGWELDDVEPMSRRDFEWRRAEHKENNPQSRCC